MAALVRYYLSKGCKVAGYDRTRTQLTDELVAEGAEITYNEDAEEIPAYCRDKEIHWLSTRPPFLLLMQDCSISATTVSTS